MNILDVVIVVVMVFLIVRGTMRGFVGEVASLAGIILGIWLGVRYMTQVTTLLKPHLPSFSFLPVVSFALIFLGVLVACNLLGWGLRVLFRKTALGWLDRTLGAGLAVVKGVVIAYLGIVIITVYLLPSTPIIAKSRLAPVVTASFQVLKRTVSPDRLKDWKSRFLGPPEKKELKTEGKRAADG
ncbi:MAG: CvpA family protein [Deltaproteobacteria bacterium]|nr:CvpA family protein [Deltaproteobacteria bacterium]